MAKQGLKIINSGLMGVNLIYGLALTLGVIAALRAQEIVESPVAETEVGRLVFSNLNFKQAAAAPGRPPIMIFGGSIENQTGARWSAVLLRFTFGGDQGNGGAALDVRELVIWDDKPTPFSEVVLPSEMPGKLSPVTVELIEGKRTRTPAELAETEKQKQQTEAKKRALSAKRSAERKAEAEKHRAFLAKLPKLNRNGVAAPVASDLGCLRDAEAVLGEEGLEARKKLSELISYGCIFVPPVLTPVVRLGSEGNAVWIKIADGDYEGRVGWVRKSWLE